MVNNLTVLSLTFSRDLNRWQWRYSLCDLYQFNEIAKKIPFVTNERRIIYLDPNYPLVACKEIPWIKAVSVDFPIAPYLFLDPYFSIQFPRIIAAANIRYFEK